MIRLLSRTHVRQLVTLSECVDTIETAFVYQSAGKAIPAGVLGSHVPGGGFHIKTAGLHGGPGSSPRFVAKVNANFPADPSRNGLPTIQGVLTLFDAADGRPLAIMDSIEITSLRTAAATAVAARYLAREESTAVTICGCGEQGRSQLRALVCVRPIRRAFAFDIDAARAESYAREMSRELEIEVTPVRQLDDLTRRADIWVTCTPAHEWFVGREHIAPGTFIGAVGADNPEKQEIAPGLLASNTVVVDVLEQCATIGDLAHAVKLGIMTRDEVYAELADIVSGQRPGRRSSDEIIVFDSTGTALEDVAAASLAYDRAIALGIGVDLDLNGTGSAPNASTFAHHV